MSEKAENLGTLPGSFIAAIAKGRNNVFGMLARESIHQPAALFLACRKKAQNNNKTDYHYFLIHVLSLFLNCL